MGHFAVLVLLLAGCSDFVQPTNVTNSSSTTVSTLALPTRQTSESTSQVSDTPPPSAGLSEQPEEPRELSPIETALPYMQLSDEKVRSIGTEVARRTEEFLATCMQAEGFVYLQVDVTQGALQGIPEGFPSDEEESRDQFGYGVALNTRLAFQPLVATFLDPNEDIIADMTAPEKQAYGQALGRCSRLAQDAIPDPFGAIYDSNEPQQELELDLWLIDQLEELEAAIWADGRVLSTIDGWATCMANQGFAFAHPDDAFNHVSERAQPILARVGTGLNTDINQALDELQEYELLVATADDTCATELNRTVTKIRNEMETAFVAQHADRIALLTQAKEALFDPYRIIIDS